MLQKLVSIQIDKNGSLSTIPFTGKDFLSWKSKVLTLLNIKGMNCLTSEIEESKKEEVNQLVRGFLELSMDQATHKRFLKEFLKPNAKEIWQVICSFYENETEDFSNSVWIKQLTKDS